MCFIFYKLYNSRQSFCEGIVCFWLHLNPILCNSSAKKLCGSWLIDGSTWSLMRWIRNVVIRVEDCILVSSATWYSRWWQEWYWGADWDLSNKLIKHDSVINLILTKNQCSNISGVRQSCFTIRSCYEFRIWLLTLADTIKKGLNLIFSFRTNLSTFLLCNTEAVKLGEEF